MCRCAARELRTPRTRVVAYAPPSNFQNYSSRNVDITEFLEYISSIDLDYVYYSGNLVTYSRLQEMHITHSIYLGTQCVSSMALRPTHL